MTETKGFYTKKVDEYFEEYQDLKKMKEDGINTPLLFELLKDLTSKVLSFSSVMGDIIDYEVGLPHIKPDTAEHIEEILKAVDDKFFLKNITVIDGHLKKFVICYRYYELTDCPGFSSDDICDFGLLEVKHSSEFGWIVDEKGPVGGQQNGFQGQKIKPFAIALPLVSEFIELQEADNEQDL